MVVAQIAFLLRGIILFEIERVAQLAIANFVDQTQHQWQLKGALDTLRNGFDVLLHGSYFLFVLILNASSYGVTWN